MVQTVEHPKLCACCVFNTPFDILQKGETLSHVYLELKACNLPRQKGLSCSNNRGKNCSYEKRWTSQLQIHLILRLYLEMPLQLWPVNTLNISGPLHMMAQPVKSHFARCRTWSSTFCRGGGRGRAQLSGYQSDCNWPTVLIGWQHLERPKLFVGPPVHKPFLWFMIWPFEISKTILVFMPYSCTLSIITVQHVGVVQKNMSLVQCLL